MVLDDFGQRCSQTEMNGRNATQVAANPLQLGLNTQALLEETSRIMVTCSSWRQRLCLCQHWTKHQYQWREWSLEMSNLIQILRIPRQQLMQTFLACVTRTTGKLEVFQTRLTAEKPKVNTSSEKESSIRSSERKINVKNNAVYRLTKQEAMKVLRSKQNTLRRKDRRKTDHGDATETPHIRQWCFYTIGRILVVNNTTRQLLVEQWATQKGSKKRKNVVKQFSGASLICPCGI